MIYESTRKGGRPGKQKGRAGREGAEKKQRRTQAEAKENKKKERAKERRRKEGKTGQEGEQPRGGAQAPKDWRAGMRKAQYTLAFPPIIPAQRRTAIPRGPGRG